MKSNYEMLLESTDSKNLTKEQLAGLVVNLKDKLDTVFVTLQMLKFDITPHVEDKKE
jgi:hypothetical protein